MVILWRVRGMLGNSGVISRRAWGMLEEGRIVERCEVMKGMSVKANGISFSPRSGKERKRGSNEGTRKSTEFCAMLELFGIVVYSLGS